MREKGSFKEDCETGFIQEVLPGIGIIFSYLIWPEKKDFTMRWRFIIVFFLFLTFWTLSSYATVNQKDPRPITVQQIDLQIKDLEEATRQGLFVMKIRQIGSSLTIKRI
jgi:hypothetical protein